MKIAVASLDIKWEDKPQNRIICEALVKKAFIQKAKIIIFPEMTLTGFSMNTKLIAEKKDDSETRTFFSALAKQYRLAIIFGVAWRSGRKATNNLVCLDRNGRLIADYAKIHTFSYAGETKFFKKGYQPSSCKIDHAWLSFSICYDLRFPEIFSAFAPRTQAIVNIANWPQKRIEHWYSLLKARAIENQCFIVGANRTGKDGRGVTYKKSSVVFDANGKLLPPVSFSKELDFFLLDFKDQKKHRVAYPFLKDRRPTLYRRFLR